MDAGSIAIIGAGPAGIAAARALTAAGARPIVFERGTEPGGRASSEVLRVGDEVWHFDRGAEFVASFYTRTRRLLEGAGVRDLGRVPLSGDLSIDGVRQAIPLSPWQILRTPLLGRRSKLRLMTLGADAWRWPRWGSLESAAVLDDESAWDYFAARIGRDYADVVLRATMDSLTLSPSSETSRVIALAQAREAAGAKLLCPRGGLGAVWPATLGGIELRSVSEVARVRANDGGGGVQLDLAAGGTLAAAAAIVATTARAAAALVANGPERDAALAARYSPAVKLNLALERPFPMPRPLCPAGPGGHAIAGIGVLEAKESEQLPKERGGLSICASPRLGAELLERSDDEVAARLQREAETLLGVAITGVLAHQVLRLPEGVPLFYVGWVRRLAELRKQLAPAPLTLAGDYLASPSIEGAVRSGEEAAARVLAYLR